MKRNKRNKPKIPEGAVLADARRAIEDRNKRYDDIIEKPMSFNNSTYTDNYLYLPANMMADLESAAVSVYPVLCTHSDYRVKNWFSMSQKNIAMFAGVNRLTARKGIDQLMERGLVERRKITIDSVHFYEYSVEFYRGDQISENKDDLLQFYYHTVTEGQWADLNAEEKMFYFLLRRLAKWDAYFYLEQETGDGLVGIELGEWINDNYSTRKWMHLLYEDWELCYMDLSQKFGRPPDVIANLCDNLEDVGLIEMDSPGWIFVRLKTIGDPL